MKSSLLVGGLQLTALGIYFAVLEIGDVFLIDIAFVFLGSLLVCMGLIKDSVS